MRQLRPRARSGSRPSPSQARRMGRSRNGPAARVLPRAEATDVLEGSGPSSVSPLSRREFAIQAALGAGAAIAVSPLVQVFARAAGLAARLLEPPDAVDLEFEDATAQAVRTGTSWAVRDSSVETRHTRAGIEVRRASPGRQKRRVSLGWHTDDPGRCPRPQRPVGAGAWGSGLGAGRGRAHSAVVRRRLRRPDDARLRGSHAAVRSLLLARVDRRDRIGL